MGIGMPYPLLGYPVDMRSWKSLLPIAGDIAITNIVRVDQHDIGTLGCHSQASEFKQGRSHQA
jgi:hypothetical protein